jgi:tetratricopeptide (TPR) repeat protein
MAALLRRERRAAEALEVLRAAVRCAPDHLAPHEALAETYLETSRWDEAIAEAGMLLRLSPRSLFARDVLSAAYLQQGRLDHALRVTDEMIRLDPVDATNHFKRGVLLQQKGQVGAAVRAFGRVLEMNPDPEVAEESRAALEMLDGYQIRQILTLAVEDVPFRLRLLQDPCRAVAEKGYLLSDEGLNALAQIHFDDLPQAPPGWRQHRYH